MLDNYISLLLDSLFSALVVTFENESVFASFLSFIDLYEKHYILLAASLGGILGISINWGIGKIINIFAEDFVKEDEEALKRFDKSCAIFKKYFVWLLIFVGLSAFETIASIDRDMIFTIGETTINFSAIFDVYIGIFLSLIGGITSLLSGFLRIRFLPFLVIVTISKISCYSYMLYVAN